MALWRLALEKSFPRDAGDIFSAFAHHLQGKNPDKTVIVRSVARAEEYWAMLAPAGEADFYPAARHLASFFQKGLKEHRSLSLKLTLHIRKMYQIIFDRLL
jgi:hypothetical protein